MRSRAPPVADAARRSTRSGRKNRASEQRKDFFGHRKAVGADAAAGYLWSVSVRSTDLFFPIIWGKTAFVSSTAKRQRGLQRGKLGSPLPCFASFCRSKRKAPAASRTGFAPCKINAPPLGDHNLGLIFLLPTFHHRKVAYALPTSCTHPAGRPLFTPQGNKIPQKQ